MLWRDTYSISTVRASAAFARTQGHGALERVGCFGQRFVFVVRVRVGGAGQIGSDGLLKGDSAR